MKTDNRQDDTLSPCHRCVYGAEPGMMEECSHQGLKPWVIIPKTLKNHDLLTAADAIAKSKGISDFSPIAVIAPVQAMLRGECKYFKAR